MEREGGNHTTASLVDLCTMNIIELASQILLPYLAIELSLAIVYHMIVGASTARVTDHAQFTTTQVGVL